MHGSTYSAVIEEVELDGERDHLTDAIIRRGCPAARALNDPSLPECERAEARREVEKWSDILWLKTNEEIQEIAQLSDDDLRSTFLLEDDFFYFNSPFYTANWDTWAGMAQWTPDQAAALLSGRDPNRVAWTAIKPYAHLAHMAKRFADMRAWIMSALEAGDICSERRPWQILDWAKQRKIEVPPQLAQAVYRSITEQGYAGHVGKPRSLADESSPSADLSKQAELAGPAFLAHFNRILKEHNDFQRKHKQFKKDVGIKRTKRAKNITTLHKIIYSMGTAGFGFRLADSSKISGVPLKRLLAAATSAAYKLDEGTLNDAWGEVLKTVTKESLRNDASLNDV